jgi:hypothetical protein
VSISLRQATLDEMVKYNVGSGETIDFVPMRKTLA